MATEIPGGVCGGGGRRGGGVKRETIFNAALSPPECPVPNDKPTVSVDVKQHFSNNQNGSKLR